MNDVDFDCERKDNMLYQSKRRSLVNVSINMWRTIYIALLVPFFEPALFSYTMPIVAQAYQLARIISTLLIFLLYLENVKDKKCILSPILICIICYSVSLIISTLANNGEIVRSIVEGIELIAVYALSDLLLQKSIKRFLDVASPILSLLCFINFITLLCFPKGMYKNVLISVSIWSSNNNWLLGYDNSFIAYLLPALTLSCIRNLYVNRKRYSLLRVIILAAICLYSVLSRWQAGSVVSILLFVFMGFLIYIEKDAKFLNAITYLISNIVMFFTVIVFRLQQIFADLIVKGLGKELTFTGRTAIWDKAFDCISQSPFFGYGIESTLVVTRRFRLNSTHNQYLWVLYRGGIVQLICLLWLIIETTIRAYKKRMLPYVRIAAISLCCLYIMWEVEAITTNSLMIMFIFTYYLGYAKIR